MIYDYIIDTKYSDYDPPPADRTLLLEFCKRFPHCNEEEIRIIHNGLQRTIYLERGENIVKIDRAKENCKSINIEKRINCLGPNDTETPFCKIRIKPYENLQSIKVDDIADWSLLLNSIQNDVTSQYRNFEPNQIKTIYSKFIIESIIEFCDEFKVIETSFTTTDLFPHRAIKHPSAYGFHVKMNLKKQFINGMFNSIQNK